MSFNQSDDGENVVSITGTATGPNSLGVLGRGEAVGVRGESTKWHAVIGLNTGDVGYGVYGHSVRNSGVVGESAGWHGVAGKATGSSGAGVNGEGDAGAGVIGTSTKWIGVYGETAGIDNGPAGVWGEHKGAGIGVKAVSKDGPGLMAYTSGIDSAAIAAFNLNPAGTGATLYAKKEGVVGLAGHFDGNVLVVGNLDVTGDVRLPNADCAEFFDTIADAKPGTVMVVAEDGVLHPCRAEYDRRAAGVVSGAEPYRPAILLDGAARGDAARAPIALVGKVAVLVDADPGGVAAGDLLTTSATPGHAMRAGDPDRCRGAVIGKALASLAAGRGLVPMLISLQ